MRTRPKRKARAEETPRNSVLFLNEGTDRRKLERPPEKKSRRGRGKGALGA